MATSLPLVQLWHHGTKICRISQADQPAPYWVVVHDGDQPSARSFPNHSEAVTYAVDELRLATLASHRPDLGDAET